MRFYALSSKARHSNVSGIWNTTTQMTLMNKIMHLS